MRNYVTTIDPFFDFFFPVEAKHHTHGMMETDVKEYKDHYEMKINVPSIERENIKISLERGYLKVVASYNEDSTDEGEYLYKERTSGEYSREFYLGEDIQFDDISAKLNNGVLFLNISKHEERKENSKFIEIA